MNRSNTTPNTAPYPIGDPIPSSFFVNQSNNSNLFDESVVGQVTRIESNVYAFTCSQCDLEFRDGGQFLLHSEFHFKSEHNAHEVVDLGYDYDKNKNLEKNQEISSESEDEPTIKSKMDKNKSLIACLFCSKFFAHETMLNHHQNEEHGVNYSEIKKYLKDNRKMFKCLICKKNFIKQFHDQYSVEKHIKKHMDEKQREKEK